MTTTARAEKISDQILQLVASGVVSLPGRPELYDQIVREIDGECDLRRIRDLIQFEPSVTARVLQVANSATFYSQSKIVSIDNAIARLGTGMLKNLVLCACMHDKFASKSRSMQSELRRLWNHSVRFAVTSYVFSKNLKLLDSGAVLSYAMLHDLGVLPILEYFSTTDVDQELLPDVIALAAPQIGREITSLWKFPDELSDIMSIHYGSPTIRPGAVGYCDLLALSHAFCQIRDGGTAPGYLADVLFKVNLGIDHLNAVHDEFEQEMKALEHALGDI